MAWVRECGRALWKLNANSDRTRAGYYYWAAEGTPHFPSPHHFGPATWWSNDATGEERLGQIHSSWRRQDGSPPAIIPAPRTVGEESCFLNGEREDLPESDFTPQTPGLKLPLACYQRADMLFDTNVFDCRFWWYAAELVRLMYTDPPSALTFAQNYFGILPFYWVVPESDDERYPQLLVVKRGTEVYLFITGTQRPVQWVEQIYGGAAGPNLLGEYGTSTFWRDAAARTLTETIDRVGDGITRWVLCGHSYGAAIAYIAAANLRIGNPDVRVDLLTYGMPKPGDQRLHDIVQPLRQTHLANRRDVIPWVPPDNFQPWALLSIPVHFIGDWPRWRRPEVITMVEDDGRTERVRTNQLGQGILSTIGAAIAFGTGVEPGTYHFMATYSARLRKACPHLILPIGIGNPFQQFTLCDPAMKWPDHLDVTIACDREASLQLVLTRLFILGDAVVWRTIVPDSVLIDLFGGDPSGKIVVHGVTATYTCGDNHLDVLLVADVPFAIAGAYVAPFASQNPLACDVELIAGGDPGPTGDLASFAGVHPVHFTMRITGPDLNAM